MLLFVVICCDLLRFGVCLLCCVVLYCAVLCFVVTCCVFLCFVLFCSVLLCFVVL